MPQPFGASALKKFEIIGVINNATSICVFPIDANREAEDGFCIAELVCAHVSIAFSLAMASTNVGMLLAVEKRTNFAVSNDPKSRPGVTAIWALCMISNANSQLLATPNLLQICEQSAHA